MLVLGTLNSGSSYVNRTKYFKGACSHCRGHIEFPVEATGMTTDCPHCGKPTELLLPAPPDEPTVPRRTIIWTLITVLILAGGLGGVLLGLKRTEKWAASKKKSSAATNATTAASSAATGPSQASNPWAEMSFAASPIHLEKTPGNSLVYAVGTINNLTNRQRFGVKVELELLNASGEKVGTARDYQQVIEPNEKWQFRALVTDSKATEAKVSAIKEQP
jgi:hypothetical protein